MVLDDLLPDLLGRIEENVEANAPIFWSKVGEIYPQIVDGMFEASILTGLIQLNNVPIDLPAGNTFFSTLGVNSGYGGDGYGNGGYGGSLVPQGAMAVIRMRAPYQVRKTTLQGMDNNVPAWEQQTGDQIIAWFPLGISGFGIYPQLTAEATVTVDLIASPVTALRPYTGNITIPFQAEFADMFSQYAAAMLRMKEGGAEAEEADAVYQAYLSRAKALSLFQYRIDSLMFTGSFGARSEVNARTQV